MIDPAVRTEAAHQERRLGRAVLVTEDWRREELHAAELNAAVDRAAAKVGDALRRATQP